MVLVCVLVEPPTVLEMLLHVHDLHKGGTVKPSLVCHLSCNLRREINSDARARYAKDDVANVFMDMFL